MASHLACAITRGDVPSEIRLAWDASLREDARTSYVAEPIRLGRPTPQRSEKTCTAIGNVGSRGPPTVTPSHTSSSFQCGEFVLFAVLLLCVLLLNVTCARGLGLSLVSMCVLSGSPLALSTTTCRCPLTGISACQGGACQRYAH